jgi:hypothetical protein
MLLGTERETFVREHLELRDGALYRRSGHHSKSPIKGEIFTFAGRRLETAQAKAFLANPEAGWPARPNRRNGRTGNISKAARKAADEKLTRLVVRRPKANVRQLAAALGIASSAVSRRFGRLKRAGVPFTPEERELIDGHPSLPPGGEQWIKPIDAYVRVVERKTT